MLGRIRGKNVLAGTVALGLLAFGAPLQAATYTVTTLADNGPGSLRQAIVDAMATPEADTVLFGVDGTITLASTLPQIKAEGGALTIDAVNRAITINGNGRRLIYNDQLAVLTVVNLTMTGGNLAAIYNVGTLTVAQSTFRENSAFSGGAIFNNAVGHGPGTLTIVNSSFSNNTATISGGGVYNSSGSMTIINSTFAGNTSPDGGGIGVDEGGTVTTVINTILVANTVGNCGGGGPLTDGGGNIDSGVSCGFGSADGSLSNTDPMITALALNAPGKTATFALQPGSPALNAGKPSACPDVDQRGVGRPQVSICDIGAYELLLEPPAVNYQGLWWAAPAGSESGWGINFAHQGNTIFATWFTYGFDNKPLWLAVVAVKTAPGVYSGSLFTTTGPPFNAVPFDPSQVVETTVGTATFTFTDDNHGAFQYTVDTGEGIIAQTRFITKQQFGPLPVCVWGAQPNLALANNVTDLWWNFPPGSESGWGINFTQQGDVIFATWFTYDGDGNPWWLAFVANRNGPGVFTGDVFVATGPAFDSIPWNSSQVVETTVGTVTLTFTDGNSATFAYTVNGISQTKTITRQVFAPPGTVCH
jgi:hypothetical protein